MKTRLIILGLLGAILNMSAKLVAKRSAAVNSVAYTSGPAAPVQPVFTTLADNLFLAVKVDQELALEDGDIVEFVFGRNHKLVSFHINDINQDLLDRGGANMLVMVHHDLALALRDKILEHINVLHKGKTITIPVKQNWQPDMYLTNL